MLLGNLLTSFCPACVPDLFLILARNPDRDVDSETLGKHYSRLLWLINKTTKNMQDQPNSHPTESEITDLLNHVHNYEFMMWYDTGAAEEMYWELMGAHICKFRCIWVGAAPASITFSRSLFPLECFS